MKFRHADLRQAIIQFSSYMESVSQILMEVGRSAPRYQSLALLYPRSETLRSYISEYFTVVVRFCHSMMVFAQKSTFSKVTSAFNDPNLKTYQSELNIWAISIKDEIQLLMVRRIEDEAEESSWFRMLTTRSSRANERQQKLAERLRVLDLISTHDYETTWKQIRKAGNTKSFVQTSEYQTWKSSAVSSTVLYTGKLGYGKSVMLANIVDDLMTSIEGTGVIVAYFFCRHDTPSSFAERTIIGAIARQALQSLPDKSFLNLSETSRLNSDRVISLMREALPLSSKLYVIIDGLHMCSASDRDQITRAFHDLQLVRNVSICASYRLEPDTITGVPHFWQTTVVPQPSNGPDIKAFIEAELERCLVSRALTLGNPMLILDIKNALLDGAEGMFLWVSLQIHSLCAMRTDEEIRVALSNLPRDLTQLYRRILEQSRLPGRNYQSDVFKLTVAARRPLSVREMQEALSVTPGDTVWDPSKLLNDVYPVLATCGCLILVDEEECTIRTVHPSVDAFFLAEASSGRKNLVSDTSSSTRGAAHSLMLSIIVTYLSYGIFGTELSTRLPVLEVGSAPSEIIKSTTTSGRRVQNIALKILRSRKQPNFDASTSIAQGLRSHTPIRIDDFRFHDYAKAYALQHMPEKPDLSPGIIDALYQLLRRRVFQVSNTEAYALLWLAIQKRKEGEIINDLAHQITNADHSDDIGYHDSLDRGMLFYLAIDYGRIELIKQLLEAYRPELKRMASRAPNFKGTLVGMLPLCHAIRERQNDIVGVLIDTDLIDINQGVGSAVPVVVALHVQNFAALDMLLSSRKLKLSSKTTELLLEMAAKDDGTKRMVTKIFNRDRILHPELTKFSVHS